MKPSLSPVAKVFKGLWFSDQHTVHPKCPTSWVLKNMDEFIYRQHDLSEIDIIVFGGDLFDRLVDAADHNLKLVQYWIREFLIKCLEHNVIVRVLEGTHSHDHEQTETFETQKPEGLDLRWVKELSVEYIEPLDMKVMYVPDNLGGKKPDEVWDMAVNVLAAAGWDKVDVIFFHGMWDYQAPPHIANKFHQTERWWTIVEHIIFSGHVHIPSEYGKNRSSGSFDRNRHGEEHPKGGYEFSFNIKEGLFDTKFWENKNALPFVTLRVDPEDDFDSLCARLTKLIKSRHYPMGSRIMVRGRDAKLIHGVTSFFKSAHPTIAFDVDIEEDKKKTEEERLDTDEEYVGVSLNKDNIIPDTLTYIHDTMPAVPFSDAELGELMSEFL